LADNPGGTCEFCGWGAPSARALDEHIAERHAGRPFPPKCDVCGQTFDSPDDLKVHNETVHKVRRA
jgi:hypothetical protein